MKNPKPLPLHFDFLGFERCRGYIRGVTHVRCTECNGVPDRGGGDVCSNCGGYGCVPAPRATAVAISRQATARPDTDLEDVVGAALFLGLF